MNPSDSLSATVDSLKVTAEKKDNDWEPDIPLNETEMNKTLLLSYMIANEPWRNMPFTYYPDPPSGHYPPLFLFGWGFHWDDIGQYAVEHGGSYVSNTQIGKYTHKFLSVHNLIGQWNSEYALEEEHRMVLCEVVSKEAEVVIVLYHNYCDDIPRDKLKRVIHAIQQKLGGKKPKWYLAHDNDFRVEDYTITFVSRGDKHKEDKHKEEEEKEEKESLSVNRFRKE